MSRRILLADDSVTIQKVIELTFMDEDFAVTAVSNGDEALARLPEVQPDLVIADVHMPGANGYEVCRRAKAWRAGVPVLLLVGTFEPFDEAQARAAGADAHLKKPFDSQELLSLAEELIARAPTAATAETAAPAAASPEAAPAPPEVHEVHEEAAWGSFDLEPTPAERPAPAAHPADHPAAAAADELPAAGRSAGFDWAETARFGRVEEPAFELDDTSEALGLDDSLLEDAPAAADASADASAGGAAGASSYGGFAAHPEAARGALSLDDVEPFELEGPAATAADIHPEPAASPASPAGPVSPLPTTAEERVGVPLGSAPLTSGLAEIEEHVHWAAERHEEPILAAVAPSEPAAAPFPAPASQPIPLGAVSVAPQAAAQQLSDEDVDRIARRVVELLGDKAVRDVAWEVVPDMAEVVIKDRLRELESQVE